MAVRYGGADRGGGQVAIVSSRTGVERVIFQIALLAQILTAASMFRDWLGVSFWVGLPIHFVAIRRGLRARGMVACPYRASFQWTTEPLISTIGGCCMGDVGKCGH